MDQVLVRFEFWYWFELELQPDRLVLGDVGGAEDKCPRGEVRVGVMLLVLEGTDQHLLEEDLV
ncbi:hypothetical protein [Corynebacterium casei]|uniref:hypothetical protein n=1 Tax=Corynebacterium casei TaxID=160386 RepID=UPI000559512B|nr:hypothetical protein [Corynebacterium casei]